MEVKVVESDKNFNYLFSRSIRNAAKKIRLGYVL